MNKINQSSFFRFLLVGGSATTLHYIIMGCLIYLVSMTASLSSAVGYTLSTVYSYWANSCFTFGGVHSHRRSFFRFFVTALIGLSINQIIFLAGIYFSFPITVSQLAATTIVLFWNYFVNAIWTFSR